MSTPDAALVTPCAEYRNTVLQLAIDERGKASSSDREPDDVDHIHHARPRQIALDAARGELSCMVDERAPLDDGR